MLEFEHIPSEDSTVADAISRGPHAVARSVQPSLHAVPCEVPPQLASYVRKYLAASHAGDHPLSGRPL